MSILNVSATPARVLVAVDTRGAAHAGADENVQAVIGAVDACKVAYMASCGAVLAGRGSPSMLQLVSSQAMLRWYPDFDALAAAIPDLARFAHRHLLQVARQSGITVPLDEQEILAAGYSRAAGRMVAVMFSQETAAHGFERLDLNEACPTWEAPWWAAEDPPACESAEAMLALARLQVTAARARGHLAIGGRLIVADVRRDSVRFDDLGSLDGPSADPA